MKLYNFRKETSERSDGVNWARKLLSQQEGYFLDSIEGCNQNRQNQVTHLMERAHVDIDPHGEKSKEDVLRQILDLEGAGILQRKINFARLLDLPLHYVLYNDDSEQVFLLAMTTILDANIIESFSSYAAFGQFLASIKGWSSNKSFREYDDLPHFDKVLRRLGTPWPVNIDCFCSNMVGEPQAIIEFQNAKEVGVLLHDNNDYFLCKKKIKVKTEYGHKVKYHDDIRRWMSQEVLRVHTKLPLFSITWSEKEDHFQLNSIEKIVFPDFETYETDVPWKKINAYKELLHNYIVDPTPENFQHISKKRSMSFWNINGRVQEVFHHPFLSMEDQTFPSIYWSRKKVVENSREELRRLFYIWLCE